MINETFYYACIYDILKDRRHPREKTPTLNHLKAKIVRLHSKRIQSITIDTKEATLFQEESPSLFHLLQMRKGRVSRMITSIIDKDGVTQTTTRGILQTFVAFLQSKYEIIPVDDTCVTLMEKSGHRTISTG